jgi:hypothetical protein
MTLYIYRKENNTLKLIYSLDGDKEGYGYFFSQMYSIGKGLFVIWDKGTAYSGAVFLAEKNNKIVKIYEERDFQVTPELIDLDGDGELEIISYTSAWYENIKTGDRIRNMDNVDIYKWDKKKELYTKAITVPWEDEFKALKMKKPIYRSKGWNRYPESKD